MGKIMPLLIFLVPVLIAFWLGEWQVIAAFIIAVLVAPPLIILIVQLIEAVFFHKTMDFAAVLEVGGLFSLFGVPIYLTFIVPLYYALKATSFPLVYSFPLCIFILFFILFIIITTRQWGYKEFFAVVACSTFHGLFILWLIGRIKSIVF